MSKKKNSKALFEVLGGQGKSKMGVPGWFGQARPDQPADPAEPTAPAAPVPVPPPIPEPDAQSIPAAPAALLEPLAAEPEVPVSRRAPMATRARPAAGPTSTSEPGDPLLSVNNGRVRISLNQISAVVLVATVVLLLFGAYQLGRRNAPVPAPVGDGAVDGTVRAPYSPGAIQPGPGLGPGVLPVPTPPGPGAAGTPGRGMLPDDAPRKKGYTYLVIQGGIPSFTEATKIKRFLYEQGVDATVHRMSTGGFLVKDMRGFISIHTAPVRRQIVVHVRQIERIGKAYQASGGHYDFRQPTDSPPWMLTER